MKKVSEFNRRFEMTIGNASVMIAQMLAGSAALLSGAPAAMAQTYPEKPIRLVVPFAAGGTSDILARLVAPSLKNTLGQSVVVDNRPGAGSNVGLEIVAKSPADGYTLVLATPALASNPTLYRKVNYDPVESFTPISLLVEIPVALVVHPSLPTRSVKQLIALAKAQPGKLNFGSSGNGGIGHLVGELFRSATRTDMVHVPFKGNGPALVALMSGALELTFSDIAGASPYIKSGKMRPLAIASSRRSTIFPQIPTMSEAGVPRFEASSWFAVFAPSNTPRAVVERLNVAFVNAVRAPETKERLTGLGFEVVANKPEELAAFLTSEIAKWSKVVKESGARVE